MPDPAPVTLDSGALIALENMDAGAVALLGRVLAGKIQVILPDVVLAQVWRGGSGRQTRIATLIGQPAHRCLRVPLDTLAAKDIGLRIRECGHPDVVDVQVALLGRHYGGAILTSDRADILAVDPTLADQIIDI